MVCGWGKIGEQSIQLTGASMLKRTMEFYIHDGFEDSYITAGLGKKEVDNAVGYLSNWGVYSPKYAKVKIGCQPTGDIVAMYFNADGEMTYELFAQLSGSGYSFHS